MWQIFANIIIFICGNLAGAYHKHLMDLALKQTYQDTCNCIKSPIKLEFEKHQQVHTPEKCMSLSCCWPPAGVFVCKIQIIVLTCDGQTTSPPRDNH